MWENFIVTNESSTKLAKNMLCSESAYCLQA